MLPVRQHYEIVTKPILLTCHSPEYPVNELTTDELPPRSIHQHISTEQLDRPTIWIPLALRTAIYSRARQNVALYIASPCHYIIAEDHLHAERQHNEMLIKLFLFRFYIPEHPVCLLPITKLRPCSIR